MREPTELRKEINRIDSQILDLIQRRVQIGKKIGEYKKKRNLST